MSAHLIFRLCLLVIVSSSVRRHIDNDTSNSSAGWAIDDRSERLPPDDGLYHQSNIPAGKNLVDPKISEKSTDATRRIT